MLGYHAQIYIPHHVFGFSCSKKLPAYSAWYIYYQFHSLLNGAQSGKVYGEKDLSSE